MLTTMDIFGILIQLIQIHYVVHITHFNWIQIDTHMLVTMMEQLVT